MFLYVVEDEVVGGNEDYMVGVLEDVYVVVRGGVDNWEEMI